MDFSEDDDTFELDSDALKQLDAIEAAANAVPNQLLPQKPQPQPVMVPPNINARSDRLARIERELALPKTSNNIRASSDSSLRPSGSSSMQSRFKPARAATSSFHKTAPLPSRPNDDDDVITAPDSPTGTPNTLPYASSSKTGPSMSHRPETLPSDDSFIIDLEDIDPTEAELAQIDMMSEAVLAGRPIVPTNLLTRQTTLTGEVIQQPAKRSFTRTKSNNASAGTQNRPAVLKVKTWNHQSAAARTKPGARREDVKGKGKAKARDEEEEADVDDEPPPPIHDGPPPSMVLKCDPGAILEWIYPLNHSKRDYQYNIVRKALFDNTLVALPTGLGKTFVAGVIMLNYYRWFPQGKIVFLAPTKPLVAQQIEASHQTCGIPGTDAAELTGMVKDEKRAELWKTKRVFYLTPQTFVNDLRRLPDLASQIVLIVIDEAHRATGAYAYATAVRDMMILNPHHRILALTATPGSTRDAVQAVVDSMHISHIEIRDENALDLREYVHRKHLQQYTVELPQRIAEINNAIIKLMEKLVPGVGQFVPGADMRTMSEYRPLAAMKNLGPGDRWAFGPLSNLSALARAREYLNTESLEMAFDSFETLANGGTGENGKPKHAQKKLAAEPAFKEIMELFRKRKGESTGGMIHPKMDRLRSLLLEYFLNQQEAAADVGEGGSEEARRKESKVMVFASFRNAVEQIVDYLNFDSPLIRAHRFIGQATNKEGRKGLKQKDQLKVVEDFKQGVFNTLVCTSIGEEGLDIGEVDFIVCYDSHKAPIKMLQRIGRTGRKKDGHIAVLVAEGKEETNFAKAKEAYNTVQQNILRGDLIELYTDVPRLLPQTARPEAKEMVMPIIGYVKDVVGSVAAKNAGAMDKFVTRGSKQPKQPKERKLSTKTRRTDIAEAVALANAESDNDDDDLELDLSAPAKVKKTGSQIRRDALALAQASSSDSDDLGLDLAPNSNPDGSTSERTKLGSSKAKGSSAKKAKAKKSTPVTASPDNDVPLPSKRTKPAKSSRARLAPSEVRERGSTSASEGSSSMPPKSQKSGRKSSSKSMISKRSRDSSDDDDEETKSSAPKRKKARSSSNQTSASDDDAPPSFVQKPTSGFVTGRGKQLAPATKRLPTIPAIDISDDDVINVDSSQPAPLNLRPSCSPPPLPSPIGAGGKQLSPAVGDDLAENFYLSPMRFSPQAESPAAPSRAKAISSINLSTPSRSSPHDPQYSPDSVLSQPLSSSALVPGISGPNLVASQGHALISIDSSPSPTNFVRHPPSPPIMPTLAPSIKAEHNWLLNSDSDDETSVMQAKIAPSTPAQPNGRSRISRVNRKTKEPLGSFTPDTTSLRLAVQTAGSPMLQRSQGAVQGADAITMNVSKSGGEGAVIMGPPKSISAGYHANGRALNLDVASASSTVPSGVLQKRKAKKFSPAAIAQLLGSPADGKTQAIAPPMASSSRAKSISVIDLADSSIEMIPTPSHKSTPHFGHVGRPQQAHTATLIINLDSYDDGDALDEDVMDESFAQHLLQDDDQLFNSGQRPHARLSGLSTGSSPPIRRPGGSKLKRGRAIDANESGLGISSPEDEEDNDKVTRIPRRRRPPPASMLSSSPPAEALPKSKATSIRRERAHGSNSGSDPGDSETKSKSEKKTKKRKRPVFDRNNAFVAMEAELSGSDDHAIGSDDSEGKEDAYDREFIADSQSQSMDMDMDSSYDQAAIYRQGLMTQVPEHLGLNFARAPVRVGMFGRGDPGRTTGRGNFAPASSSPPRGPPDPDDVYEFGSFVVEDEELEEEGEGDDDEL